MSAPVFISFASGDRKAADTICEAVEQRGMPCWIATRNIGPGENFQEAITRAIRAAKVMILAFSAHANNSLEVKKEIALAGQYNVVVVPVRVEDVAPNDALSYELAVRQWIDLFDNWEQSVERLVAQLSAVVEATPHSDAAAPTDSPASAAPPAAPRPMPRPAGRRGRGLIVGGIGVAVVLLAAVGAIFGVGTHRSDPQPGTRIIPAAAAPTARAAPPPTVAPAAKPTPARPVDLATLHKGQVFRECPNCPEMIVLPPGHFKMGGSPNEATRFGEPPETATHEQPQHDVTIGKPLAVAKFDVTRGDFAAFVAATGFHGSKGCAVRSSPTQWNRRDEFGWEDPGYPQTGRDPVACVDLPDIESYLEWLRRETGHSYRLPSEAEWEYAARGGATTAFYWGDDPALVCQFENVFDETAKQVFQQAAQPLPCRDGYAYTAPVGSFKPNPFGLYDMLANLSVMTDDCWNDNYTDAPTDGSPWRTGNCAARVMRKASFFVSQSRGFRAAARHWDGVRFKNNRSGFRVVLSLP